jgi:hypothetical protein
MERYCISCGVLIHPKRIEILPNTKTCVNCSTTGTKRGIPVMHGDVEKDDTWVDMVFMEPEEFEVYNKIKNSKEVDPIDDQEDEDF